MKKIISLVLVLVLVLGSFPVFATEATYGEQLFDLGLVKGVDDEGTLDELGTLTRAQMMVVLARLYGVEADALAFPLPSGFTDVEDDAWYSSYVAYARVQGWTNGYGNDLFGPDDAVTEQMVAAFMLRALGYTDAWEGATEQAAALGIDTVASTPMTRGEVFEMMFDTINTENTEGVVLGEVLGVFDVSDPAIESATVVDVNEIEVKFNKAVDTTAATVKLMKGLASYNVTLTWNEAKDTATLTYVVDYSANTYTVKVEGLTDEALTMEVTVAAEVAASMELVPMNVDIKAVDTVTVAHINVYNQYGTFYDAADDEDVSITIYHDITELDMSESYLADGGDDYSFDVVLDVLAIGDTIAGDTFRITAVYKSFVDVANSTFGDVAEMVDFGFGTPYVVVDEGDDQPARILVGKSIEVPYTSLDQYGNPSDLDGIIFVSSDQGIVTDEDIFVDTDEDVVYFDVLATGTLVVTAINNEYGVVQQFTLTVSEEGALDSAQLNPPTVLVAENETAELAAAGFDQYGDDVILASTDFDVDGGVSYSYDDETGILSVEVGNADADITVAIVVGDDVLAEITFDVEAEAYASAVSEVNFNSVFEVDAIDTLTIDDVVVLDQYGREFTPGSITVTEANDDDYFDLDGLEFTALEAGTNVFTVQADCGESAVKDFTLTAIDTADIASYELSEIGTVYATTASAWHVALELVGKTSTGEEIVLIDGKIAGVTSSDETIARETDGKVEGVDEGTATIKVWDGEGTLLGSSVVTVSIEVPVLTTIALADDAFDTNTLMGDYFDGTDQYGVDFDEEGTWYVYDADGIFIAPSTTDPTDTLDDGDYTIKFISNDGMIIITEDVTVAVVAAP